MRFIILFLLTLLTSYANAQKYKSRFVKIKINKPSASFSPAQGKDRLLGYKGKLLNDSILATAQGNLVMYSQNKVVVEMKYNKTVENIIKQLELTESLSDKIYNLFAARKSNVMLYPRIEAMMKEFHEISDNYVSLTDNTIPLAADDKNMFVLHRGNDLPDSITRLLPHIETLLKEVEPLGIIFQVPSALRSSECYACDSTLMEKYHQEDSSFFVTLYERESEIFEKIIQVERRMTYFSEKTQNALQPKIIIIQTRLDEIKSILSAKIEKKLSIMFDRYAKDFSRIGSMFKAILNYQRQMQLLNAEVPARLDEYIAQLIANLEGVEKFLDEQLDKKNYSMALNMTNFLIGLERQKQFLGVTDTEDIWEKSQKAMDKFAAFNRFKLYVTMDYSGTWGEMGNLDENLYAVDKAPTFLALANLGCRYSLYPAEEILKPVPNYHFAKRYIMELEARSGVAWEAVPTGDDDVKFEKRDLTGLKVRPAAPFFSISFCEDAALDTLDLNYMHLPGSREVGDDRRYGIWHLTEFSNLMKDDGWRDNNVPSEALLQELSEIKEEYNKYQGAPISNPTQQQMLAHYYAAIRNEALLKEYIRQEEKLNPTSTTFDARDGDEVLVDNVIIKEYKGRGDGASDDGNATFKIRIRVTHDPLPYK